jgi:hypothetical protein
MDSAPVDSAASSYSMGKPSTIRLLIWKPGEENGSARRPTCSPSGRGWLHGVGQRHQPPVFNLLAGDHGHRLRGLARRQRQGVAVRIRRAV